MVQSEGIDLHYDHAHNEWIEWTSEGGLLALSAAVGLLFVALRQKDRRTSEVSRGNRDLVALHAAGCAAISAVASHALWDFSLRIPAVAVLTAATLGTAMGRYSAGNSFACRNSPFPPASTNV
jgi:O-antigen ligase